MIGYILLPVLWVVGRVGLMCVRIEQRLVPLTPGYIDQGEQIDPHDLGEFR
ncbi:unnamed protein product [marine sediment metagenome]|uniref:Uncharacterized protein n=1 Tax=marine sediment metagenome TaxID=412755 RepID=X0V4G6_9ZZZZ